MMRNQFLANLILFVIPLTTHAKEIPTAKPEDVGMSSKTLAEIEPKLKSFIDHQQIPGAITLIARKGKIVYANAQGWQSIEKKKPMKLDSIVRMYSMSKPITSSAIMILVDEGKLKLDDPVAKHLPEFKNVTVFVEKGSAGLKTEKPKVEMTIRDLLRHTGGLTYGLFGETPVDQLYREKNMLTKKATLKEMVTRLSNIPLAKQPRTEWIYSISTDVLGRIVEVASGMPFDKFLNKRIFGPLDMKDTSFFVPREKLGRFTTAYQAKKDGKGLEPFDLDATGEFAKNPKLLSGGGGLCSTGRDYLRFCQMILNGGELEGVRILRKETVAQMTRNQLPKELMPIRFGELKMSGVGFGLGFSVRVSKSFLDLASPVGEIGWDGYASTHFWISPKDKLIVITLTQFAPYSPRLSGAVKPIVYRALK